MKKLGILMAMFLALAMVVPAWAQNVSLNPEYAQRNLDGRVRMHIILSEATNLLSMGIKISFDPTKLQVDTDYTSKNKIVWQFTDLLPDSLAYAPDIEIDNASGTVTMIGGRLQPGINDTDVLLGWVTFDCSSTNTGNTNVTVGLANPPPYDNFVGEILTLGQDPPLYDSDIDFEGATICIVTADACEGDFENDQNVDMSDMLTFKNVYPSTFPNSDYTPGPDFNADGNVDMSDMLTFKNDYPRGDCLSCSD